MTEEFEEESGEYPLVTPGQLQIITRSGLYF
jgi:hypothetical protein